MDGRSDLHRRLPRQGPRHARSSNVVFSLDGKRIGNRTKSPFQVYVRAAPGRHTVRARVTFKDATARQDAEAPLPAVRVSVGQPAPEARRASPGEPPPRRDPPACAGGFGAGGTVATAPASLVAPAQAGAAQGGRKPALVVLLDDHVARTKPSPHARRIGSVAARRPLTRVRTVLPVIGSARAPGGQPWLKVRLPGRPNGHKGWIPSHRTRPGVTAWHIVLKLSTRRVAVHRFGRVVRRFRVVVGKPSTPTPRGKFFIEEALTLSSHEAGGPFALATSARSPVLQEFAGGPGQIALHGTDNLSGALGTAVSHGCIRLSTRAITWLAKRIRGGVPLTVKR